MSTNKSIFKCDICNIYHEMKQEFSYVTQSENILQFQFIHVHPIQVQLLANGLFFIIAQHKNFEQLKYNIYTCTRKWGKKHTSGIFIDMNKSLLSFVFLILKDI